MSVQCPSPHVEHVDCSQQQGHLCLSLLFPCCVWDVLKSGEIELGSDCVIVLSVWKTASVVVGGYLHFNDFD